jgi:hypothetical protein
MLSWPSLHSDRASIFNSAYASERTYVAKLSINQYILEQFSVFALTHTVYLLLYAIILFYTYEIQSEDVG